MQGVKQEAPGWVLLYLGQPKCGLERMRTNCDNFLIFHKLTNAEKHFLKVARNVGVSHM